MYDMSNSNLWAGISDTYPTILSLAIQGSNIARRHPCRRTPTSARSRHVQPHVCHAAPPPPRPAIAAVPAAALDGMPVFPITLNVLQLGQFPRRILNMRARYVRQCSRHSSRTRGSTDGVLIQICHDSGSPDGDEAKSAIVMVILIAPTMHLNTHGRKALRVANATAMIIVVIVIATRYTGTIGVTSVTMVNTYIPVTPVTRDDINRNTCNQASASHETDTSNTSITRTTSDTTSGQSRIRSNRWSSS